MIFLLSKNKSLYKYLHKLVILEKLKSKEDKLKKE